MQIRTAVVGFGFAGQIFHAPFLTSSDAYSLDLVVTGNPERGAAARAAVPGARVVATLEEALAERPDLVVVATPPASHVAVATAALEAGSAVVVDKPMSADAASGRALLERAEELGRPLTVYQNRRWDGDLLTVRRLLADGALGQVRRFESRFERWKPQETKAWKAEATWQEGGGVMFDLGAHLIDQALLLFGPATVAHAEVARYHRAAEDDVFLSLAHDGGVTSHLWMSQVTGQPGPRLRVLGSDGAFTKTTGDVQEGQLVQGMSPLDDAYGRSAPEDDGVLGAGDDLTRVPTEVGSYATFYEQLAAALREGGPLPVDPRESLAVIELIEQVHRELAVTA